MKCFRIYPTLILLGQQHPGKLSLGKPHLKKLEIERPESFVFMWWPASWHVTWGCYRYRGWRVVTGVHLVPVGFFGSGGGMDAPQKDALFEGMWENVGHFDYGFLVIGYLQYRFLQGFVELYMTLYLSMFCLWGGEGWQYMMSHECKNENRREIEKWGPLASQPLPTVLNHPWDDFVLNHWTTWSLKPWKCYARKHLPDVRQNQRLEIDIQLYLKYKQNLVT